MRGDDRKLRRSLSSFYRDGWPTGRLPALVAQASNGLTMKGNDR